jgi:siroheme synthase
VTAGIGGLAYAGIPVTHRDTNHTVTFLTGHDATGVVPDRIDWDGVARGSQVIVMYMAMKHIADDHLAADRCRAQPRRAGGLRHRCLDLHAAGA